MTDYLVKPLQKSDLRAALQNVSLGKKEIGEI